MTTEDVATQFVAAINQHDNDACYELMAEDFRFIDSEGMIFDGRKRGFWPAYFKIVPDYKISIS